MFAKAYAELCKALRFVKSCLNCLSIMGALAFMVSFPGMVLGMVMTIRMFFGTRTPENQAIVDAGIQANPHLAFIADPWFWLSATLLSGLLFIFSEWAHPESQRNRRVLKQLYLPWPPAE